MKKISKQQKLMNEAKEEVTEKSVKQYTDLTMKGDSTKESEMKDIGMSEEEYNTDTGTHNEEEYEEDKFDANKGPGGIKFTEEHKKKAAKMLAETEAYIIKRGGNITFADLKAFKQDRETIKNAFRMRQSIQKCRINVGNQMGMLTKLAAFHDTERHPIAAMVAYQYLKAAEDIMDKNLKQYASMYAVGVWAQSICGVGPVFAASLLALLELKDRKYAGQFWAYAGLTGRYDWDVKQKGSKVQYNPELKALCFRIGESFIKCQSKPNCTYGQLYAQMVEYYTEKSEQGKFKELADLYLSKKNWNPEKETYKIYSQGKLPKSHIKSMARRYAVKRFLAHLFEAYWYAEHYYDGLKDKCPNPYVEDHLGHHDIIHAPNLEIIDQWYENNGYANLMSEIETEVNANPDKTVDEVVVPENEAQSVIVDAYKKIGNHTVKLKFKMKKIKDEDEESDT